MQKHNVLWCFSCRGLIQVSLDVESNLLVNLTTLCEKVKLGPMGDWNLRLVHALPGLALRTSHLCVMAPFYTRQYATTGHSQDFLLPSCLRLPWWWNNPFSLILWKQSGKEFCLLWPESYCPTCSQEVGGLSWAAADTRITCLWHKQKEFPPKKGTLFTEKGKADK